MGKRQMQAGRLRLRALDLPVMLLAFPAPHPYTGENSAELQMPGNPDLLHRLIDALIDSAGAIGIEAHRAELKSGYKKAFDKNPDAFRCALCEARDLIGKRLALTWEILSPDFLSYEQVARTFLTVDRHLSNWQHQSDFATCFRWRGIGSTRV